jgi:AcrR family transcriptional regulator
MARGRHKVTRDEMLEQSRRLLEEGTLASLTVDALAKNLHMSKSTLYKHYASKDDLVIELVDHVCSLTEREVEEANFTVDTSAALDLVFEIASRHASSLPTALLLEHDRLPKRAVARLTKTSAQLGRAFRNVIRRGSEEGTFHVAHPDLAATCFVASVDVVTRACATGEVEVSREEAITYVRSLLGPGLGIA